MRLKETLKKAKEIEKQWLEQQKPKEMETPKDFVEFCVGAAIIPGTAPVLIPPNKTSTI